MHTEATLNYLDKTTTVIGRELRSFAATTQTEYKTVELPGEAASRARRGARKKANAADPSAPPPPPPPPAARGKYLNLLTYKFHALGDYVRSIRFFGTSESYSTQTVCPTPTLFNLYLIQLNKQGELAHRFVKRLYGRTNKNNATKQMTRLERRDTRLRRAAQSAAAPCVRTRVFSDNDATLYTGLDTHHQISKSRKEPIHLFKFVKENSHDPAKKVVFFPSNSDHSNAYRCS